MHRIIDNQRRQVLQALLVITALAGVAFFLMNMQRGAIALAVAELVMAVGSAALFFVVRRTPRLKLWTLVYIVPFFITLLYALSTPNASATAFIWALLPPILAHLLLGRWLGLAVAVLVMAVAAVLYALRFHANPALMEPLAVTNVVVYALTVLILSHAYERSRERAERALRELASTDALTGLANRGEFQRLLERELSQARRRGGKLSLLLIDLDHFKAVNDVQGHAAGDAVLITIARVLEAQLRQEDWAFRLGGEEFGVLLPGADAQAAALIAERLREAVEGTGTPYGGETLRVTASLGLAELGPDGADVDALYRAADSRLYRSKSEGRNRLTWADEGGIAQAGA